MKCETLPADEVDSAVDTMRIGVVELGEAALAEQIGVLSGIDCFAEALSRVTAADTAQRRQIVGALSRYDMDAPDRGHRQATSVIAAVCMIGLAKDGHDLDARRQRGGRGEPACMELHGERR